MEKEFLQRIEAAKDDEKDVNFLVPTLQKKYGLTLKQLYYREHSILNVFLGDVGMFNQENPTTVLDGFRTSGSSHYSQQFCDEVQEKCLKPIIVGNLIRDSLGIPKIEFNASGKISVWEWYEAKETYFMTVDAAGGKREIHIIEKREPDKTVIDVWNRRTGKQVAQWYGHVDYDLISDVVVTIGIMYGKATACVELNNHGYKVVGDLKGLDYPMYSHKPGEYGWLTNKKTKPELADGLLDGCRDGIITIRCKETVEEMRIFVEKNGKFGAEAGGNDDRVLSAQMARQMMALLPRRIEPPAPEEKFAKSFGGNSQSSWMAM